MTDEADMITALLERVRSKREGRDAWRTVAADLRALRSCGVSYRAIHDATGVSPGTVARQIALSRTPGNSPSTGTS